MSVLLDESGKNKRISKSALAKFSSGRNKPATLIILSITLSLSSIGCYMPKPLPRIYIYICISNSLTIHEPNTKEINIETQFRYLTLDSMKFWQFKPDFPFKCGFAWHVTSYTRQSYLIRYPNISKLVKKLCYRLVFSTQLSVFGCLMKHPFSCVILHLIVSNRVRLLYIVRPLVQHTENMREWGMSWSECSVRCIKWSFSYFLFNSKPLFLPECGTIYWLTGHN